MVDVSLTESLTIIPTYSDGLRNVVLRTMNAMNDGEEKTSPALTVPEQTKSEPVWLEIITEYLSIKI